MNSLQYLMLGMSASIVVGFPFLLVKAIRRKQWYRLFEMPLSALVVFYLTLDVGWPSFIRNAPPVIHRLLPLLFLLWLLDFLGFFRWLFNRQRKPQT